MSSPFTHDRVMIVKRARDKLYFSIPAQLKASFRLLINRNFPWDCSRIHHCHRRRLQWACPPPRGDAACVPLYPLIPIWSSCTKSLLKHLFGRSFVVYMKILSVFKDAVLVPAVLQIKSQLAADHLQSGLRCCLLTLRFTHFVFSMFTCIPSSLSCSYLWLQIGCDYTFANEAHLCISKKAFFFFL